jgi:hypothetical protein
LHLRKLDQMLGEVGFDWKLVIALIKSTRIDCTNYKKCKEVPLWNRSSHW